MSDLPFAHCFVSCFAASLPVRIHRHSATAMSNGIPIPMHAKTM